MKSEPFRFSPTSAGVRAEHINFHNNNNRHCINNNCRSTFSLPRARVLPPSIISSVTARDDEEHQCLDQVVVQNSKIIRTEPLKKKRSNRMRNCLIFTGVVVIVSLLSFVLFVECRSITGVGKQHNNPDISPDSRIQDDSSSSSQEPSAESSEEFPTKVLSTTSSSKDFSSSKTTPKWSSSGRLTRSRVSVICKGGAPITDSTPVIISTTKSSSRKANSKSVDLPTLLPRVTDGDDDFGKTDEEQGDWHDYDTTLNSGESQVVTVSGYSHVAGAKPETKSHKTSSIASIRYVPKSSPNHKAAHVANLEEDSVEIGDSSEETVIITVKPKSKSGHAKPRSKTTATNHERRPAPTSSTMPQSSSSTRPTTSRSRSSRDKKNKQRREKNNRENNEKDTELEEEKVTQEPRRKHSSSNSTVRKSSKRSRQGQSKDSSSTTTTVTPTTEKQEKGDSGELNYEEDSLFPTLATPRKSKGESRRENGRKSDRKKEKTTTAAPANEEDSEDVESAEAEPIAIVEVRQSSSRKSSRSRKAKGGNGNKNKGTSPPRSTPSPDADESSEEYNMEEMPFTDPSDSGRRKSRKSSNSYLSNLRMSSKTPKLRTRPFSSFENDD